MSYKRLDPSLITPAYEDAGLFKNRICHVTVKLVPLIQRNQRDDLVVTGFVQDNIRISVLFAGRRKVDAAPLMAMMQTLKAYAEDCAKERRAPAPDIEAIRVPVRIEGAWRPRFARDQTGWETKFYHLIAARWIVTNTKGDKANFGEIPLVPERVA